jgi:hypothetical protein
MYAYCISEHGFRSADSILSRALALECLFLGVNGFDLDCQVQLEYCRWEEH